MDVQSYIRSTKKLKPGREALLGRHGEDVVAVAHLGVSNSGGRCEVFIVCAAIGLEYRGEGGGLADDLMQEIRRVSAGRCRETERHEVMLWGKIHSQNKASQRMVRRAGFEPLGVPSLTGYETWGVQFRVE